MLVLGEPPAGSPPSSPAPEITCEKGLVHMAERQTILVTGAAEALQRFPNVDGLVLSVGAFLQDGPTVLPNGHEAMFAANVLGPFLFTEILSEKLKARHGLVAHVIAPFREQLDWDDLEGFRVRRPMLAFNRYSKWSVHTGCGGDWCSTKHDDDWVSVSSRSDSEVTWGAKLGIDIVLTKRGNWTFGGSLSYLDATYNFQEDSGQNRGSIDLDPLMFSFGGGFRF